MPDFGRPGSRGSGPGPQEPSLDAVRRTDSFIDALAGGRPATPQDPADAELAALLGNWRDELRWPPATGLLSEADVMAAFNAGRAQKRTGPDPQRWTDTRQRSRRSLSVIGATAAAVLCVGGFGAVVAGSGPGDALYGVRTMFGAQKQVRDDQVGLAAKTELNQVQTLIAQGDWQQAQDKLVAVSTQVATIDDQQQKQELLDQFNDLSAKVVERDPAATAPPGVVYTVPPSSAALVPAVEPTSTPSTPPSPTTSTTTETPSSSSPATSSTMSTSSASAPSSTSSAEPTTSATAPQSPQATTPTSGAPVTTSAAPAITTAPPSAAAPSTPASPTSVGASPEAPRSVSGTPEPAPTTVSETPGSAPSPAVESAPASAVESVPSTVAITTTAVPAPAAP